MILKTIFATITSIAIFTGAATASELEQQELIKDCKHEAVAVGLSGADIDEYIIECVADFEETTITTNIKLPTKK